MMELGEEKGNSACSNQTSADIIEAKTQLLARTIPYIWYSSRVVVVVIVGCTFAPAYYVADRVHYSSVLFCSP
jgi:hypothetical protein